MGLLRSLKTKFQGRSPRKPDNSAGIIPSLSSEANPTRSDSIARKPLPARAKVELDFLRDTNKPGTPPKDNVTGPTIRLIRDDETENAISRSPTASKGLQSNRNHQFSSDLDPRAYWGTNSSSNARENATGSELEEGDHNTDGELPNRHENRAIGSDEDTFHEAESSDNGLPDRFEGRAVAGDEDRVYVADSSDGGLRNRFEGLAIGGHGHGRHEIDSSDGRLRNRYEDEYRDHEIESSDGRIPQDNGTIPPTKQSLNAAGVNLEDTIDTDYRVTHAPAVTNETIHHETTEILQESVTREIHEHDHYNYIQPVLDVEVLPERHFMRDVNGHLFEIPAPSGHEIVQRVVGETYVDMKMLDRTSSGAETKRKLSTTVLDHTSRAFAESNHNETKAILDRNSSGAYAETKTAYQ